MRKRTVAALAGAVLTMVTAGVAAALPSAPARTDSVAGVVGGGPTGDSRVCSAATVLCDGAFRFGLSTPDAADMGQMFNHIESMTGEQAALVGTYQDFTEPFYVNRLNKVVDSGRVPVVTWEPFRSTAYDRDSFPLASIAAGKYDTYLKKRAAELRQVRGEVIVRFGHEMNGFWYPWGQPRASHPNSVASPTNTPARYRAAYRHVVNTFRAAGVTNATWMWSPNLIDGNPNIDLASLYPGNGYVDVVGLSGYVYAENHTFANRYLDTLALLDEFAATKPVVVAETGVYRSPNRITQIGNLVTGLVNEPRFVGFIYFSQPDSNIEYDIDADPAAAAAVGDALRSERAHLVTGAAYASADTPKIVHPAATPRVGDTHSARLSWRGTAHASTVSWFSCPTSTFNDDCTLRTRSAKYEATPADRGRYLFNRFSLTSARGVDEAISQPVGPVRTNPPAADVSGIDLLTGAVRIRFAPATGITNRIISVDSAASVYLPAATTEYWINGLAPGTSHTVEVTLCDCPYRGASTTYAFTVVPKPPAATATATGPGAATVAFPAPADGQTGWLVLVDGTEHSRPSVSTSALALTGLASGSHSVAIARLGGNGATSTTATTVVVP